MFSEVFVLYNYDLLRQRATLVAKGDTCSKAGIKNIHTLLLITTNIYYIITVIRWTCLQICRKNSTFYITGSQESFQV